MGKIIEKNNLVDIRHQQGANNNVSMLLITSTVFFQKHASYTCSKSTSTMRILNECNLGKLAEKFNRFPTKNSQTIMYLGKESILLTINKPPT